MSRDSVKAIKGFREKYALPFLLLSDPDQRVHKAYDVLKEKVMYGRKVLGVDRSTFIIDEQGRIRKALRGVKVEGHAAEVLGCL